ncbi:hypothetical protein RF11_03289 [Thelohanellus kitauei]|uniref:Uncharacterized protein n=1 Tax=Thelohanellus kitauei TaxID=669202 RepID=A0A0C2MND8_THEKT|nr:hypothetical protein RF11_03289 [Thelohanellus kitauei]
MSEVTDDTEWKQFADMYDKFIYLVNDFREIELQFRENLKQTKLDKFEKSVETRTENLLTSITGALNKQLLNLILYEHKFNIYSYELIHSMATIFANAHKLLEHPELDNKFMERYYTVMSRVCDFKNKLEDKYLRYLTSFTANHANKREIVNSLSAEVQILKLITGETPDPFINN